MTRKSIITMAGICVTQAKSASQSAYFLNALKSPLYETPERAYTNAGTCALKAGDLDGAQGYLLQGIQLSRDGAPQARVQLAKLYFQAWCDGRVAPIYQ
jgi:type IV pilus assembly protein PilF